MQAASGGKTQPEILSTHQSNQIVINDLTQWIPEAKKHAKQINEN